MNSSKSVQEKFSLLDRVAIITGGAGLLGAKHAEAIAEYGGIPVLIDINREKGQAVSDSIKKSFKVDSMFFKADITKETDVEDILENILNRYNKIDILINNAANDPKIKNNSSNEPSSRLENFPIEMWESDLDVGLKGSFICSKIFGSKMASQKHGVILNIASDLGIIAPDQRIYEKSNIKKHRQVVKPITYSVVKHGILGLTKYLSTYWSDLGVRSNALLPGGVYQGQNDDFVEKLTNLIPLGRMANEDDYKAAIVFLVSDASSYMTGSSLIIDGGRTAW